MKQLILFFLLLVGVMLFTAGLQRGKFLPLVQVSTPTSTPTAQNNNLVKVGSSAISVDIADTPEKLEKGLSIKDYLGPEQGMLFIVQKNSRPVFWMKDMKFGIDILWIDDGKIVAIHENAQPQPNVSEDRLTKYRPPQVVDYVLEVQSGFTKRNQIIVGTPVELPNNL